MTPPDRVPVTVGACVALYAAAIAFPAAMPVAVAACATALGALVLLRRRTAALALAVGALGLFTVVLLGGAWLLAARPRGGFIYVVGVLFFLFLPVAPWLYARTFSKSDDAAGPPAESA